VQSEPSVPVLRVRLLVPVLSVSPLLAARRLRQVLGRPA
jgi:hypothetical protein